MIGGDVSDTHGGPAKGSHAAAIIRQGDPDRMVMWIVDPPPADTCSAFLAAIPPGLVADLQPIDGEIRSADAPTPGVAVVATHPDRQGGGMWTDLVSDHTLELDDGRSVGWTQSGDPDGRPVLRIPGTPGSRWTVRADQQPWLDRNLLMITTERPGFGVSSRLPGRGFAEPPDDLAAILDQVGVDRVPVYGSSGGAPHILALCAKHPDRVSAATVLAGAAPMTDAEAEEVIPLNRQARMLAMENDLPAVEALLNPLRDSIVDDPLATIEQLMASAPADDLEIMADPLWQEAFVRAWREALVQGVGGWADETIAMITRWDEIDLGAVETSVVWRHAPDDRNVPASAARRAFDQLPNARWDEWPAGGHLVAYHREAEVLDDLLGRADAA